MASLVAWQDVDRAPEAAPTTEAAHAHVCNQAGGSVDGHGHATLYVAVKVMYAPAVRV